MILVFLAVAILVALVSFDDELLTVAAYDQLQRNAKVKAAHKAGMAACKDLYDMHNCPAYQAAYDAVMAK